MLKTNNLLKTAVTAVFLITATLMQSKPTSQTRNTPDFAFPLKVKETAAADLAKAFQKPRKSEREILNGRLLRGCIWGSLGLIFTICSIIFYPCGIIEDADEFSTMLLIGLCMMGIGASYLAVYFTSRKNIEAEEKANKEA